MENEEFDFLSGQINALSSVINILISNLEALPAAQGALQLAIAMEEQKLSDAEDGTPERTAHIRNTLLENYVALLSAVAKRR